jgi:hypothetical protein
MMSLRVPSNKCQTLLAKAVFGYFLNSECVASIFSSSSSLRNSSAGANLLTNFHINENLIKIFNTVFTPEDCFSVQFTQELQIRVNFIPAYWSSIFAFVKHFLKAKYVEVSLRLLKLDVEFINDEELCFIVSHLKRLTTLILFGKNLISIEGVKSVASNCPNLEVLILKSCDCVKIEQEGEKEVGSKMLEQITSRLQDLRVLDICGPSFPDLATSRSLRSLVNLTSLLIRNDSISDKTCQALARMTSLTSLKIGGRQITNDCLQFLSRSTSITALWLDGVLSDTANDDAMKHLSMMKQLTTLVVDAIAEHITEASLDFVCTNLEELTSLVFFRKVTAVGVTSICKLNDLKLFECSVIVDGGMEKILEKFPKCQKLDSAKKVRGFLQKNFNETF